MGFYNLGSYELSMDPQCLKITEKVAFNIASEASYVYFLSGQKLPIIAKNRLVSFWKPEAFGEKMLPD